MYNIPSLFSKRSTTLGLGNKVDLTKKTSITPGPGTYVVNKRGHIPGSLMAMSREVPTLFRKWKQTLISCLSTVKLALATVAKIHRPLPTYPTRYANGWKAVWYQKKWCLALGSITSCLKWVRTKCCPRVAIRLLQVSALNNHYAFRNSNVRM